MCDFIKISKQAYCKLTFHATKVLTLDSHLISRGSYNKRLRLECKLEGVFQQGCNLMFHDSTVKIGEKEKEVWKEHENHENQKR
jgi:chemotaxis receptor (MCP) glutamine deamidase CheD